MKKTVLSTLILFIACFIVHVSFVDAQNSNRQKRVRMRPNTEDMTLRKGMERRLFSQKWKTTLFNKQSKPAQHLRKAAAGDGTEIYGWSLYNDTF